MADHDRIDFLVAEIRQLRRRLDEAEAIIRAHRDLEDAMYNNDLEVNWPDEAHQLREAYERRYGVSLDPDADREGHGG